MRYRDERGDRLADIIDMPSVTSQDRL